MKTVVMEFNNPRVTVITYYDLDRVAIISPLGFESTVTTIDQALEIMRKIQDERDGNTIGVS